MATLNQPAEEWVREFRTEFRNSGGQAYKAPWYRAVRWDVAVAWLCIVSMCLCLCYLGIFIFTPFGLKIIFGE